MEIREYIQFARRWLGLILLAAVVGGAGAYVFSRMQEPVYRATTVLLVNESDIVRGNEFAGIQASERLAQSYVERLKSPDVLEQAAQSVGLRMNTQELREMLQVRLVGDTQLIELSVEHTDPIAARELADTIPTVFAERNSAQQLERYATSKASLEAELGQLAKELNSAEAALVRAQARQEPDPAVVDRLQDNVVRLRDTHSRLLQSYEDVRVAEASSLSNVVVDTAARLSPGPVRPRMLINVLLSTVMGAAAAVAVAFLVEYMDNTVKDPDHVEKLVGAPTLGAIAEIEASRPEATLVVEGSPRSPTAEAYRQLRTNLMYSLVSRNLNSVLITSPNPGEGKTTTAANLALALVLAGKRVILVDSDLRRPALHRLFNLGNKSGLTDLVLAKAARPDEGRQFLQRTAVEGLFVLPSGPLPPNPAELLDSERMAATAVWLAQQADYVIYDSPPVLAVTDAAVLSRLSDTTLMVIRADETSGQALLAAWANLQAVESDLAGVVINRVRRRTGYYSYHYYHYYQNGASNAYSTNGHNPEKERKHTAHRPQ